MPPGVVKVRETALKKQSSIPDYIKHAVPQDSLYKRVRGENRILSQPFQSMPQLKPDLIFKRLNLDIKCEKEPANDVDFEKLF